MTVFKKTFRYGPHDVTLEAGELARQADGAVLVSMGETVVLVTAVAQKTAKADRDFFPLTVNYIEKTYAAGRIPGGFFRREGRPSEKETLTSRLIDRPIRPLFPDGFHNEVQVVATVLSLNPDIDADIPAMLGASAALTIAGVPFNGPIGGARVGYGTATICSIRCAVIRPHRSWNWWSRAPSTRCSWSNRRPPACPRTSCWAPWCLATSRCRKRSATFASWPPRQASRAGTGSLRLTTRRWRS